MTEPSTMRRVAVVAIVVVALAACSSDPDQAIDGPDSSGPADSEADTPDPSITDPTTDPTTDPPTDPPTEAGRQPEGFTTIQARITEPDGEVCEVCLWLADDAAERGRGLMDVTDLGDAVGMAFRFDEPTAGSFYMFQTPSPLSIAWFGPDGSYVGSADMDPCLDTPAGECPLYSPGAEYDLAIEVFEGGLEPLGLVEGSSVELIEGSEAERCPAAS
jgi:uncharacterized membrane protein (UPF0127 family)